MPPTRRGTRAVLHVAHIVYQVREACQALQIPELEGCVSVAALSANYYSLQSDCTVTVQSELCHEWLELFYNVQYTPGNKDS